MKKKKDIKTLRWEAVLEDMKIQIEEMKKISRPTRFIDKFNAFFRMRCIAELILLEIQIKHTEKQNKIFEGQYDYELKGIVN